jgi:hypothetical protein
MAWATEAEALTYTGITVTAVEIAQAQGIVELFTDVTEESNITSPRNLRLLKMAVAYQAAFIVDHPDMFTHVDVSTMLQDGIQFTVNHENAGILAPLARRAIARLSWANRNRSLRIQPSRNLRRRSSRSIYYLGTLDGGGDYDIRGESQWEQG